jgi:four helix bundle protein
MKFHDYEKLIVWQKSMDLVVITYHFTKNFPREEQFGLTSQIRRASVSIPSNISEGCRRSTKKDFCHFLIIAMGSASELDTQLKLSRRLGFIKDADYNEADGVLHEILRMLNKLIERFNE